MNRNILVICVLVMLGIMNSVPAQAQDAGYELAPKWKEYTYCNPLIPWNLCADPTAVEYNGRLYVYGTNDQQELNTTKNTTKNTYGKITQLVCMSTADLINWTFHGVIDVKAASSWIATSWAPSIVSRVEKDGKTHFYLYYTNTASGIGVLTATSPVGPWRDPLGRALINGSTPGRGLQSNIIDPGVCIDDEGNGWLTFGGGDPNSQGSKLMPGNARIVKLGSNMISLDGEIKPIPAPFHFEANELNYINGKFVFSYSGGWSCNSGDWSKYTGRGSYACPGNCSILSMTTDDPINGTWTYTGEVLKNPGSFGYPWGNNHSHMQKFLGKWYMIYHTQYLEGKMGISGGYRCIAMNKLTVNESTARITACSASSTGLTQLADARPDAFSTIEAETMANGAGFSTEAFQRAGNVALKGLTAGSWTQLRGITFPQEAKSFSARLKGKGTLEVRLDNINAKPIATVEFNSATYKYVTVDLKEAIPAGKIHNYLYLVFTSANTNARFDCYCFNSLTEEEITPVMSVREGRDQERSEYYTLDGVRLDAKPARGMYIERNHAADGSIQTHKHVR